MKLYLVGAKVSVWTWYDCVDRCIESPHLLGVYTKREYAEEIARQFDCTITEVETDTFLNDCRETTCDYNCNGKADFTECESCKYAYDILHSSGISIVGED